MTDNPGGNVTTIVIQLEPGWVYVKVAEPKPPPERIEFFLKRTIEDWFSDHPGFAIDRAEQVFRGDELLGMHVWYREKGNAPSAETRTRKSSRRTKTFAFEIHEKLAKPWTREYIEAVVDDALKILPTFEQRNDTHIIVNRRQVGVIIDPTASRGAVVPLEYVLEIVHGPTRERLDHWLAEPDSSFYIMHMFGSWFSRQNPQLPAEIAQLIDRYGSGPRTLRDAIADMTPRQIDAAPIAGKWSTRQVICHLADFETIMANRMKHVIAEDQPSFPGGFHEQFARRLAYDARDIDEEIRLIEVVRSQTARILRTLPPEAFARTGIHSIDGPMTLKDLLERITNHIPHHAAFIQEKRRAME